MFTRIGRGHGEGSGEVEFFRKLGSSAVPSVAFPAVCFSGCGFSLDCEARSAHIEKHTFLYVRLGWRWPQEDNGLHSNFP
jgi:hypothetical protein